MHLLYLSAWCLPQPCKLLTAVQMLEYCIQTRRNYLAGDALVHDLLFLYAAIESAALMADCGFKGDHCHGRAPNLSGMQVVGTKHVLEAFRVGVTAVMLAAKQNVQQGNLKHKDLTGQEVGSQVCITPQLCCVHFPKPCRQYANCLPLLLPCKYTALSRQAYVSSVTQLHSCSKHSQL